MSRQPRIHRGGDLRVRRILSRIALGTRLTLRTCRTRVAFVAFCARVSLLALRTRLALQTRKPLLLRARVSVLSRDTVRGEEYPAYSALPSAGCMFSEYHAAYSFQNVLNSVSVFE